ncbi:MAG: ASKHA domain-containing protein [Candidatus Sumerlaeaceae bacterium]|nr:ASKHA domain-containing protein [Candidatus Sumerlaeaceae bacterium]
MTPVEVVFLPEQRTVTLPEPTPVSDAAACAEVLIDHPCGARASCGKCRVRFLGGAPAPTEAEARLLSAEELNDGWRLSCQCVIDAPARIEVPTVSRVGSAKGFGPDDLFAAGFTPHAIRRRLLLPEPDLDYQWSIEDSLAREFDQGFQAHLSLDQMRRVSGIVELAHRTVDLIATRDHIISISPASSASPTRLVGVAVDVGSTSVAAALVDLETGAVITSASMLNPQVQFGADVISRISFAQTEEAGNERLHECIIGALNDLVLRLTAEATIEPSAIVLMAIAGNPAMLHTVVGADLRPLGQSPYVGVWTRSLDVAAADLRLKIHPAGRILLLPMIRSNVGADTVAGIIATGLDQTQKTVLFIDLGTNSEIVLVHQGRMLTTSTAAGPAFEGANIRHGMRAAPGAIDRVSLRPRGDLAIHVLGGVPARGLCGSGLIDGVAVLLRTGIVNATGRMLGREALDEHRFPLLAARLLHGEVGHSAVILSHPHESEHGYPVLLSAIDVRQLQLVKGSIHAGAMILMQEMGLTYADLDEVLIAGAFGQFVRKTSAIDIGLVPPVDPERVLFVGNAAGVGARMVLVDASARERADRVRETAGYLELGGRDDYQDAFADAMGFHDSPALAHARGRALE